MKRVVELILLVAAFVLGMYYFVTVLLAIIVGVLAMLYANWYMKHGKVNKSWLEFLSWSNVATWLIPVVGFFTSVATFTINQTNHGKDRNTYMWLAGIGFVLSLANSIIGVSHLLG